MCRRVFGRGWRMPLEGKYIRHPSIHYGWASSPLSLNYNVIKSLSRRRSVAYFQMLVLRHCNRIQPAFAVLIQFSVEKAIFEAKVQGPASLSFP